MEVRLTVSYDSTITSVWQHLGLAVRRLPGSRYLPWSYIVAGTAEAADEIPRKLIPRTVVVVRVGDRRTWIAFDCPRHHNERVMLNLSTRRRPCWRIEQEPKLTLYPSVDAYHSGQRCHFWVRQGKPKWVEEIADDRKGLLNDRP
ncbi:DUF6527 family protein [Actinophytocola glycyrrhizae]|uniref:DUF6527 family protein n=1 Tax=Actinophytocola glycyrrhizae TaxID=2044873 RepID=A0ABV9SGB4_9PSEU